jgi:lysophospholipase L1-like esterase
MASIGHRVRIAGLAAGLFASPLLAQTGIDRMGALGDSLSDEYLEESYDFARNWPQIFVDTRGIDFGALPVGPCRPEPRRCGYEDNWARSGHNSATVISSGAHTGLAGAVTTRGVTHATILIGSNDFSPLQGSAFSSIYNNAWTQAQIDSYVAGRLANVRTMLDTLTPTGVRLLLVTPVDIGYTPTIRTFFAPSAAGRERVAAAVRQFSNGVDDLAQEYELVLFDLNAMGRDLLGSHASLRSTLLIGNRSINLNALNLGSNPSAGWVSDGVHPNTILQAVFADAIASALNTGWGTTIDDFSEAEMLSIAGLTYGGSDTLASIVGDYSSYIRSYVPVCAADLSGSSDPNDPGYGVPDGDADASDFFYFLDQFSGGNLAVADLTGASDPNDPTYSMPDGDIDADDFFFYLDLFVQGCD